MPTGTESYYVQRASEYDQVYAKPERQSDIAALDRLLVDALAGRQVLEVAAGTGFWTARYADAARRVTATDVNEETLRVARSRRRWPDQVGFAHGDAFTLDDVPGTFDAAFIGFFWSHVVLADLDHFLDGVVRRLAPGARVVVADNTYVAHSNHPIARTDEAGNTYQQRRLTDGSQWEVLKNFPSDAEVAARLDRHGTLEAVTSLTYYWAATLRTPDGR